MLGAKQMVRVVDPPTQLLPIFIGFVFLCQPTMQLQKTYQGNLLIMMLMMMSLNPALHCPQAI